MEDFINKIDGDPTDAGVVVAKEYNSIFTEAKNAVSAFLELDETDNKQLQKAVDIASKAMYYKDAGTVNAVKLSRGATTETTETLFDGMVLFFTPAHANTGATTLKVKTLGTKALKHNGTDLPSGYLTTTSKYMATYDLANDRFNVDVITGCDKGYNANGYWYKLSNGLIVQFKDNYTLSLPANSATVHFDWNFPIAVPSILGFQDVSYTALAHTLDIKIGLEGSPNTTQLGGFIKNTGSNDILVTLRFLHISFWK